MRRASLQLAVHLRSIRNDASRNLVRARLSNLRQVPLCHRSLITQTRRSYSQNVAAVVEESTEGDDLPLNAAPELPGPDLTAKSAPAVAKAEELPKWTDYSDKLDPMILETMKNTFRYKHVTKVQQTLLDLIPTDRDLLVRSKTGTGKTLAFLVPALQRALERYNAKGLSGTNLKNYANQNAAVFIVSPTRELANQIATEARRLVTVPGSNMKALCCVGGDSKRDQLKLLMRERNDFIVGTPGRLLDLLENDPEFLSRVANVQTLILDEADTLLEMGFRPELNKIMQCLPKNRQNVMFSATVSREIQTIAKAFLHSNQLFINTVSADEQDVHTRIKQEYIIRPATEHMKVVLSLLISQQLQNPLAKVIVFLPTTKMTMLYTACFRVLRRLYPNPAFQQFDIHAQRTQDSRSKVSKAFREANAGTVLFTTDVSARGVDYPGVSHVIQVGSAGSRDLYIHRIGRTGRAGQGGQGTLILQPFEREYLRTLGKDIPLVEKDFPDSEIALGNSQQKVFQLMHKIVPLALVEDAFSSLTGALIPRARDFRAERQEVLEDLVDWFKDLAGESAQVPPVRMLMGPSGFNNRDRTAYSNDRSRSFKPRSNPFDGTPTTEYRPRRPTEHLYKGKNRVQKRW